MAHIKHESGNLKVTLTAKKDGDEDNAYDISDASGLFRLAKDMANGEVSLDLTRAEDVNKAIFLLRYFPQPLKADFLAIPGVLEGLVNKGKCEEVLDTLCDMTRDCKGVRQFLGREHQIRVLTAPGVLACLAKSEMCVQRRKGPRGIHAIVGSLGVDGLSKILVVPDARESLKEEARLVLLHLQRGHDFREQGLALCISNPILIKFLIEGGCGKEIIETLECIKKSERLDLASAKALSNFESVKCLMDAGYDENILNIIGQMESGKVQAKLLSSEMVEALVQKGHGEGVIKIIEKMGLEMHHKILSDPEGRYIWSRVYDQAEVLLRPNVVRNLVQAGQAESVLRVLDKMAKGQYQSHEGAVHKADHKVIETFHAPIQILLSSGALESLVDAGYTKEVGRIVRKFDYTQRSKIAAAVDEEVFSKLEVRCSGQNRRKVSSPKYAP